MDPEKKIILSGDDIARRIADKADIGQCAICGKCLSVCPTYRENYKEIDSPRGRLNLIASFLRGEITPTKISGDSIYNCLLCGACSTACPREIKPAEAIEFIRSHPDFKKFKTRTETFILKRFVKSQKGIKFLAAPLKIYQNAGLKKIVRRSVKNLLPNKLRVMESLLPEIPDKCLTDICSGVLKPKKPRGLTVMYYPGCAMNYFLPHASRATINLLLKLGIEVVVPSDFNCCGAPHIHEGEAETALKLALGNIEALSKCGAEYIITDCASCGASLKKYPDWFYDKPDLIEKCRAFSNKALDISELLTNLNYDWEKIEIPQDIRSMMITFDNPCELRHGQGIKNLPVKILKKLSGIEFIQMPESDWCCGAAGAFVIRNPEESMRIFSKKAEILRRLKADIILTLNPGCYFQYKNGLPLNNIAVKPLYYTEFLDLILNK